MLNQNSTSSYGLKPNQNLYLSHKQWLINKQCVNPECTPAYHWQKVTLNIYERVLEH